MVRETRAGRFDIIRIEKKSSGRYGGSKSFLECRALKPNYAPEPTPGGDQWAQNNSTLPKNALP